MEILVLAFVFSAIAAAVYLIDRIPVKKRRARVKKTTFGEMERLNLLLQNVEAYDGSPKGQKRGER